MTEIPPVWVCPESVEALQSWIGDSIREKKPFLIRGKNSRFPQIRGDVLATKSINEVLFFDPDDLVVGVQAGVEVGKLQGILGKQNLQLPINPWYSKSTIGSVVACNDFGPDRMNSGGLRDCIIGIEYINGKGELVKSGGKVVKNVTGYDLGKMMLGSLGGLGMITSVNFKLTPSKINPQIFFGNFDSSAWLDIVKKIHETMIPLDWVEAVFSDSCWRLGLGYSGNERRTARIEKDLKNFMPENYEVIQEGEVHGLFKEKGQCYPALNRSTGFLESILSKLSL
ncbi:MAG: FAD-binding oxidoreductase, partial [Proteobacteria bacterium]|nr:FAD-binding oxidoreductase [Pseudomonadota bacterium]